VNYKNEWINNAKGALIDLYTIKLNPFTAWLRGSVHDLMDFYMSCRMRIIQPKSDAFISAEYHSDSTWLGAEGAFRT
jgi:hypothetical protein